MGGTGRRCGFLGNLEILGGMGEAEIGDVEVGIGYFDINRESFLVVGELFVDSPSHSELKADVSNTRNGRKVTPESHLHHNFVRQASNSPP